MSDYLDGYEDGRKAGRTEALGWAFTLLGIAMVVYLLFLSTAP